MEELKNASLRRMREILDKDYSYTYGLFDCRTQFVSLVGASLDAPDALCFEVYPGAPFCLFVAPFLVASTALRKEALRYALATESISVVAFFNREDESFDVLKRRYRDIQFDTVQSIEHYQKASVEQVLPLEYQNVPISNKLENLFFEMHSLMRDSDGLHADAALEELCKLIYLKSYLEEQQSTLPVSTITRKSFGCVEEYAACLRALYSEAIQCNFSSAGLQTNVQERSRGVFEAPIYLSSSALVRCFQLIEGITLTRSDVDLKGRAFQKVLSKSVRSGMGQYFTPVEVCQLMVQIIAPTIVESIIDPFCGSGHFLTESLSYVRQHNPGKTKEINQYSAEKLHGIEKSDRMTRVVMTDMHLNGFSHPNIRCTDALLDFKNYPDWEPESFDVVLTNPPFGSTLGAEACANLATFTLNQHRKKIPLEILGLERSIQFLKPEGRIAIVLPANVFNAESLQYVRDWLLTKLSIRVIIDLPPKTFFPFGANISSGILFARRLRDGETTDANQKVCMIRVDDLGYDATGRETTQSDVAQAVETATNFLNKEGW